MKKKICDGATGIALREFLFLALIFFCLLFCFSLQNFGKGKIRGRDVGTDTAQTSFDVAGKYILLNFHSLFPALQHCKLTSCNRSSMHFSSHHAPVAMIIGRLMFSALLIALCFMLT
jgi:uncharacterized membrane protein